MAAQGLSLQPADSIHVPAPDYDRRFTPAFMYVGFLKLN